MAGNCPQITVPLPLGMGLDADPRIVGEYLAIPVSGQNAELTPSASSADMGTTWPVALGIQLATSGASAYALQGDYLAIDVAEQSADLVLADPGSDIGITAPLTLGLLLGTTAYTLVGEHLLIPISFAPGEAYEEDVPDPVTPPAATDAVGGFWPDVWKPRKRRKVEPESIQQVAPTRAEMAAVAAVAAKAPRRRITAADLKPARQSVADELDQAAARRRRQLQEEDELLLLMLD